MDKFEPINDQPSRGAHSRTPDHDYWYVSRGHSEEKKPKKRRSIEYRHLSLSVPKWNVT